MNWKDRVEQAFAEMWTRQHPGTSREERERATAAVPFSRKAMAVSGIITLSAALSGCADEPVYTAYEECLWAEQQDQADYDCEDDDDWFYKSHKYKGKSQALTTSSRYVKYKTSTSSSKGGIGSGFSGGFGG